MKLKKVVKMGWGAFTAIVGRKKLPLNVMLSVTNRCFSHCNYCNIPNRNQRELTSDEIFSLIDQISKMGCQRLGLWGGEPLIRDDICQIVDYAKRSGLFVTLDSDGYLIPQKLKMLSNLDHLILSLDGPEEIHDLNRTTGSFHKTMEAIEAAAGKVPFWTITVLTKHNLGSIEFILQNASRYGFLTTFQLLHHNDRLARNQEELLPDSQLCKAAIKEIIKFKKKGAPVASSFKYLNHILNWLDYRVATSPDKIGNIKCQAGSLYCNVDTDGSVYPCSLLVGKVRALNFLDVGFKTAFQDLRSGFCKGCLASCFTEYNCLFSLDLGTVTEWLKSMRRTRRH
jgi:MoaA/NifB/PqqE/SkfB family radical SAM enzyme